MCSEWEEEREKQEVVVVVVGGGGILQPWPLLTSALVLKAERAEWRSKTAADQKGWQMKGKGLLDLNSLTSAVSPDKKTLTWAPFICVC